jgi:probable HAF family extracellular repeat protein
MSRFISVARATAAAAALAAGGIGVALAAPLYHVIDTGVEAVGMAIDDAGAVAGVFEYYDSPFSKWQDGVTTNLQTPGFGGSIHAVGPAGNVVGSVWTTPDSVFAATLWNGDGSMINLGMLPGDTDSEAFGINDAGTVVGFSMRADYTKRSFIYRNGRMKDLDPKSPDSEAWAINKSGQVAGARAKPGDYAKHAYLYTDGKFKDLGGLGGVSDGRAINAQGHVVGQSQVVPHHGSGNQFRAIFWNGSKLKNLGTIGGNSVAVGINDDDQIVGYSQVPHAQARYWVWIDGTMFDLAQSLDAGSQGWSLGNVGGINSTGQIVMSGSKDGVHAHMLILDPVTN